MSGTLKGNSLNYFNSITGKFEPIPIQDVLSKSYPEPHKSLVQEGAKPVPKNEYKILNKKYVRVHKV